MTRQMAFHSAQTAEQANHDERSGRWPNPINDRKYTKEHEWAKADAATPSTMGITDHAQELLTDVVYVELPAVGQESPSRLQPICRSSNR